MSVEEIIAAEIEKKNFTELEYLSMMDHPKMTLKMGALIGYHAAIQEFRVLLKRDEEKE